MSQQGAPEWTDLPQELLLLIIGKLIEFGAAGNDLRAMINLRSTCRAWRAASSQFPAVLFCKCPQDLNRLCTAFPQLASLYLLVGECSARDFRPLSSCTQLTSITFWQQPMGVWESSPPTHLDPRHLPNGLRDLSLKNVLPIRNFGMLQEVTHLSCSLKSRRQAALSALLQELPSLKVASLHSPYSC